MKTKPTPSCRLGWFRYYVNRYNRYLREDCLHMALWYWALMVQDNEAPDLELV